MSRKNLVSPREEDSDDLVRAQIACNGYQQRQKEDLESIASFGDDKPCATPGTVPGATPENIEIAKENRRVSEERQVDQQKGLESAEARSLTNGSPIRDGTPYDSACMLTDNGPYPGFDVYVDAECQ